MHLLFAVFHHYVTYNIWLFNLYEGVKVCLDLDLRAVSGLDSESEHFIVGGWKQFITSLLSYLVC